MIQIFLHSIMRLLRGVQPTPVSPKDYALNVFVVLALLGTAVGFYNGAGISVTNPGETSLLPWSIPLLLIHVHGSAKVVLLFLWFLLIGNDVRRLRLILPARPLVRSVVLAVQHLVPLALPIVCLILFLARTRSEPAGKKTLEVTEMLVQLQRLRLKGALNDEKYESFRRRILRDSLPTAAEEVQCDLAALSRNRQR